MKKNKFKIKYIHETLKEAIIEADDYCEAKNKFENKTDLTNDSYIKTLSVKIFDIQE